MEPALHGFNLPQSNYVDGGQSKLKGYRKISLIDSVMEDCIEFLIQAADYENFLNNSEVVRGRGLSQFEREERECREERNYFESAVRAIMSGDLLKRWKQLDSEPRFVPGGRAKHKAPRDGRTGVQGTVRNKTKKGAMTTMKSKGNDGEKKKEDRRDTNVGQNEEEGRRTMPDHCWNGRNPRYDSDDANFNDSYMEHIDPEEDYWNVPINVEKRQINEPQRVEYFTIGKETKTQSVSVCQGCVRGLKIPSTSNHQIILYFGTKCTESDQLKTTQLKPMVTFMQKICFVSEILMACKTSQLTMSTCLMQHFSD